MAANLPDCYHYHATLHLLICKEYHTAIPKNKATEHLQKDHLITQHQMHLSTEHKHLRGSSQPVTLYDANTQSLQPNRYFFKVLAVSPPHTPTRAGAPSPSPTPGPSRQRYARQPRVIESSDSDIEIVSARDVTTSLRPPASLPT
ncbi:hypothetical protein MPDQ_005862, partial [Monascus purpureus]